MSASASPSRIDRRAMRIEVCIDAQPAAEAALADGADRLEVCARLDLDGLSPKPELLRQLRAATERPLFAMVRPRPGDFVLQDGEPEAMRRDLEQALELGADGVVIGCLTAQGEIPDQELGWVLDALPQGFPRTFHRAFERALDPAASLARIASLGFDRVLGSGRPGKVVDHLPYLTELVALAQQRGLAWLPGGGVRPHNADQILAHLPVQELHSSAGQGWAAWRRRA